MKYLVLALLWSGFGIVHSLLSSGSIKKWISCRTGGFFRFYRLTYNLISVATLLLAALYQSSISESNLFHQPALLVTGWLFMASGVLIIIAAFRNYDLRAFSGIDAFARTNSPAQLQRRGLLRYVRHPLYSGIYLVLWGYFLTFPLLSGLVMATVLSMYLRAGIYFEEKKLIQEFGELYHAYQKEVPMLWPKWS